MNEEEEAYKFQCAWHVLLGRGLAFVDEGCGRVYSGALQEADNLCDN